VHLRAAALVNKRTNLKYVPAGDIDVNAVLEGRDDPGEDPLDIVFGKYAADPFYCQDHDSTARHRGGSNGRESTST